MTEESSSYIEYWQDWFAGNFSDEDVPKVTRNKFAKNLVENEVFSVRSLGRNIEHNPDFLKMEIMIKNAHVANAVKVCILMKIGFVPLHTQSM